MLMYDAIRTFVRAMEGVSHGNRLSMKTSRATCNGEETLEIGSTVFNYLNAVSANILGTTL